jgi:hypothetical protein
MKTLITSILLLIFTLPIQAQERKLEKVDDNLYKYEYVNDNGQITQSGYYKKVDGSYLPHGFWKDNAGTKAEFRNGIMVWIKPKGKKKYTFEELQIQKLKSRIARLEEKLTSL